MELLQQSRSQFALWIQLSDAEVSTACTTTNTQFKFNPHDGCCMCGICTWLIPLMFSDLLPHASVVLLVG